MLKATKTSLMNELQSFTGFVSREYGFVGVEPAFAFTTIKATNTVAYYDSNENRIAFKASAFSCDTVCHELAHWVQFQLRGDTACWSMRTTARGKRDTTALAVEHARIQKHIEGLMRETGYRSRINDLYAGAAFGASARKVAPVLRGRRGLKLSGAHSVGECLPDEGL